MNFGTLIPQIFYDCIARMTPGPTITYTIFLIWWPELSPIRRALKNCIECSAIFTGISIILFSYVISLVLEGLRHIELNKAENKKSRHKNRLVEEIWNRCLEQYMKSFGIPKKNSIPRVSEAIALDMIRLRHSEAGSRIVKLRAELGLLKTLSFGWVSIMIVYIAWSIFSAYHICEYPSTMKSLVVILVLFSEFYVSNIAAEI
jgi:hypothetical protein